MTGLYSYVSDRLINHIGDCIAYIDDCITHISNENDLKSWGENLNDPDGDPVAITNIDMVGDIDDCIIYIDNCIVYINDCIKVLSNISKEGSYNQ